VVTNALHTEYLSCCGRNVVEIYKRFFPLLQALYCTAIELIAKPEAIATIEYFRSLIGAMVMFI
jgi:hypothetical protein